MCSSRYSLRGCRPRACKRCSLRTKKLETMSRRPTMPSDSFSVGKSVLELPTTKPLINRTTTMQTRVREAGSGCCSSFGSNGGSAMMSLVCAVLCVISDGVIASNENKISDGWRGGALLQVEGGISMEREERGCQPFAASLG
jgi:hypothetical protein